MRLRETGTRFYELLPNIPIDYGPDLKDRIDLVEFLNHMFGYVLGQILAQQCGITSETLDVTKDPDVAAFFAVFDFSKSAFLEEGTGVIYRFEVGDNGARDIDLSISDFYHCPSYIDAEVILSMITPCDSWEQAFQSFINYATRYIELLGRDTPANRPIELLQLPGRDLTLSRVMQQYAGLLIPDMILSTYYQSLNKRPPLGKAEKKGGNAIEDLAARNGAEAFLFCHTERSPYVVPKSPQVLFPKNDPFMHMLVAFLGRLMPQFMFSTETGVVSPPYRPDLMY